jgi:hypothetical protein
LNVSLTYRGKKISDLTGASFAKKYLRLQLIQAVLDELSKEPKVKTSKFEDFVDMRALNELEREGVFK